MNDRELMNLFGVFACPEFGHLLVPYKRTSTGGDSVAEENCVLVKAPRAGISAESRS